ncbi:MAG: hypothetical protein V1800_11035, partial [Candidatus Latescibacterota bacterium]
MKRAWFLMIVLFVGCIACAKTGEETIRYAQQIGKLQHYNETLERYLKSLEADPDGRGEVTQVAQLLQRYKADLLKIPRPSDSKLKAIHGRYERSIANCQKRLLPPEDMAFSLQAQRAIGGLKEDVKDGVYPMILELLGQLNLRDRVS